MELAKARKESSDLEDKLAKAKQQSSSSGGGDGGGVSDEKLREKV